MIGGTAALLLLPFAALLINRSLARNNPVWASARSAFRRTGPVPLIALIAS